MSFFAAGDRRLALIRGSYTDSMEYDEMVIDQLKRKHQGKSPSDGPKKKCLDGLIIRWSSRSLPWNIPIHLQQETRNHSKMDALWAPPQSVSLEHGGVNYLLLPIQWEWWSLSWQIVLTCFDWKHVDSTMQHEGSGLCWDVDQANLGSCFDVQNHIMWNQILWVINRCVWKNNQSSQIHTYSYLQDRTSELAELVSFRRLLQLWYGRYSITILDGVFKPTYNWAGHWATVAEDVLPIFPVVNCPLGESKFNWMCCSQLFVYYGPFKQIQDIPVTILHSCLVSITPTSHLPHSQATVERLLMSSVSRS